MAWRTVSIASAVAAVALCATPAAGALTPSPKPLPGSSFQGADGDLPAAAAAYGEAAHRATNVAERDHLVRQAARARASSPSSP